MRDVLLQQASMTQRAGSESSGEGGGENGGGKGSGNDGDWHRATPDDGTHT